jgi:hypothetical protein
LALRTCLSLISCRFVRLLGVLLLTCIGIGVVSRPVLPSIVLARLGIVSWNDFLSKL